MQNKIKEIANFQTYFGQLQNGDSVAALIFPSNMRSFKYPNSFKVNEKTGHITFKNTNHKKFIIPNNTVKESLNVLFRLSCNKNKKHLDTLTFESGMLWGFEQALVDWMYFLPSDCSKVTIYGGEILNGMMLSNLCYAMRRTPNKTMCIYTYNDEAVDYVRFNKLVVDNILIKKTGEWDYKLNDSIKFDFPKDDSLFIVPASSFNIKYLCKS